MIMNEPFESVPFIIGVVLSIVFLLTGVYQIITGKKSFLMCLLVRRCNLADSFTKVYGCMAMIEGCILLGICLGYWYFSRVEIVYIGFVLLCVLGFCEPFAIRKYQVDIEGTDKKRIIINSIFIIMIISIGIYFRPMTISSLFDDTTDIKISYSILGVSDGETYIDSTDYYPLTEEEKVNMLSVLSKYTYERKLSTFFQRASQTRIGNEMVMLYTEKMEKESQIICISSLGEIIVNNHVYTAKDSWKMIEEMKDVIGVR